MTPNTLASGHEPRHPRTIAGVVLAFFGVLALTVGVTGSPAAGLSHTDGSGPSPTDMCLSNPDLDADDPYCLPVETEPCESNPDLNADDPYCTPTTTEPTTTAPTTTEPCESNPDLEPDDPYCFPTTTTVAPTTTTTVAPTTTTTVAPTTTSTTSTTIEVNPPTTSSTTTTTEPCEWNPELEPDDPYCTTTTTENTVENAPPTTSGTNNNSPAQAQLPRTGSANTMLALGALLLLVGGVMVLSTRREHDLV